MNFPSPLKSLFSGLLAVALVPLAAAPAMAQMYGDPGYGAPQYAQPQQQYYGGQPSYQPNYESGYQPNYAPQQLSYAPQGAAPMAEQQAMDPGQAAMSPDQIEQLVAPIALYPDALIAQILAGATYPAQIAAADQWVHQIGPAGPDQVAAAASAQTEWDPSIKALTAYPQVLDMLAGNLQWTTVLGNAYYNQPQDVLQTVQVMRMRAEQAGTLVNTPQMQVIQNAGYISLAPPTPDMMYVPTYNPWTAYGDPVQPYPGFSFTGILSTLANAFLGGGFGGNSWGNGGGPLQFLASFALGAFNRTPFGLISWGLDWLFNALTFHHSDYYTASASVRDWGLPHGGPRYRYYAHSAYAGNRFGGYNGYNHQAIAIHGRNTYGDRFGSNTYGTRFGGNNAFAARTNPGFNRPQAGLSRPTYGDRQFANNREMQPAFRGQYGNSFANRATPMPARQEYARGYAGMQPSHQTFQSPMRSFGSSYGNYGSYGRQGMMGSYGRQNTMAYGGGQNFHQSRGSFFGGGGSYKQPKFSSFKEPKMPKMHSFKMPKEHFSSGGGHHFGGGGHSGGHGGGHHH